MGKKIYIGGGKFCYTDNCTQHDTSEAGQLTIKANEAAATGRVSEFLRYKEEAAAAVKRTGERSSTALSFPSFSPDDDKLKPSHIMPRPAPPITNVKAPVTPEQQAKQQAFNKMIKDDIASYSPNETSRSGEGIVKFHKDIGFPSYFRAPKGSVGLSYSDHALHETQNDRYGRIPVLDRANFDELELIEIKYSQNTNRIDRLLYRQRQGDDNVCLVIKPQRGSTWKVITTWFNESGDDHMTLNRSRYSVPNKVSL